MPGGQKTIYELLLELGGKQNPSLKQAFDAAQKNLTALNVAAAKMNAALKDMSAQSATTARTMQGHFATAARNITSYARNVGSAWSRAGAQMRSALHPILGPLGALGRMAGIAGVVGGAVGGIEVSRLVSESSKIAAEREVLKTQIHTLLQNKGQANMTDELLMQMRTYADMESIFRYLPVANVAAQMLVSKYKTQDILPEMRKIGELSKDDETLKLVGDITSQVHQRGYVTKMDLTRMQKDAHVPIYEFLLKAMGQQDTLANEVALFKRLRTPTKNPVPAQYFENAEEMMVQKGGPYYHHQIEQLMTFQGQANSVLDRFDDAMQGIGDTYNRFLYPMMRMINQIKPQQISDFFGRLVPAAGEFGDAIRDAFTTLGNTGRLNEAWLTVSDIFSKIGKEVGSMFGVKGGSSVDKITGAFDRMNDVLHYVNLHFKDIAWWTKAVLGSMLAINAIQLASGIVASVTTLGSAVIGLGTAAAGAGNAMKGLALAEGEASVAGSGLLGTLSAVLAVVGGSVWLARYVEEQSRKHAPEIIQEHKKNMVPGGHVLDNPNAFPDSPAMRELTKKHQEGATMQQILNRATAAVNSSLLQLAISANATTNALSFLSRGGSMMGNFPITGVGGSNERYTEFGRGVPGDQPGGPTFDKDSYRGIGHIGGKAFNLDSPGPQPTAMKPEWARYHYKVAPGGTYISDKDKQPHRYMDSTGGRNPKNEDFYKGSSINIHYNPNINVHGDVDHGRLADTMKGHSEHLAGLLDRAMRERARLEYA